MYLIIHSISKQYQNITFLLLKYLLTILPIWYGDYTLKMELCIKHIDIFNHWNKKVLRKCYPKHFCAICCKLFIITTIIINYEKDKKNPGLIFMFTRLPFFHLINHPHFQPLVRKVTFMNLHKFSYQWVANIWHHIQLYSYKIRRWKITKETKR